MMQFLSTLKHLFQPNFESTGAAVC